MTTVDVFVLNLIYCKNDTLIILNNLSEIGELFQQVSLVKVCKSSSLRQSTNALMMLCNTASVECFCSDITSAVITFLRNMHENG